uniref:SFRICE_030502 n=1 Tax=Spodoptera frugiperda TaxID=7108 RepID=A0A2H1WDL7_SPOFR
MDFPCTSRRRIHLLVGRVVASATAEQGARVRFPGRAKYYWAFFGFSKIPRIILYATCVGLVCSIILMFVVTLGMGIGLGYNYCFVDMKTKYKYIPGHYVYPHNLRFPYYYRRSGDQAQDPARAAEAQDPARAAEEELENDQLRKGPMRPPETGRRNPIFDSPTEKGITDFRRKLDDPTPEPAFPDEKRRVKKLVIPISGLDLVSLLSKLSAEKNNHSLQIVTT